MQVKAQSLLSNFFQLLYLTFHIIFGFSKSVELIPIKSTVDEKLSSHCLDILPELSVEGFKVSCLRKVEIEEILFCETVYLAISLRMAQLALVETQLVGKSRLILLRSSTIYNMKLHYRKQCFQCQQIHRNSQL
ncbi:hypothetical protein EGR_00655 [Echinococcus granulosus]|uniref:Uncharacterized protein n=1 Tax=Echinococcus granulosus TaxID=6210 RepID=W6USU7_ECHGR|nr:hypothetical protein EGR_00655 [Echinococcus granulosus]EUB64705.1 hypothetical protein EGR_00655 [Echinococcus granulosus]